MSEITTKTHAKKGAWLAAYATLGTVRGASEATGIAPSTHYDWLRKDPEYPARFAEAQAASAAVLEEEARRRATEGWEEPVFHMGEQCGTKRRYSDTLLIFLMKGNQPAKFGDRIEQTHKGNADSPVHIYQLPDNGRS